MKIPKEFFSKVGPYLGVWARVEGTILIVVATGIILPFGGKADVVIAVAVALWGAKKLFWR